FLIYLIFITSTTAAVKSPAAGGSTLSVYSATKIARIFLPDSKDTLKIEYLKKGNKPETMILLHGFGASIYTWRNNIDELSKHFTVYAYNHLGAGKSNNPFPKYDLAAYTKQLLYFMENMKIKKAILVGNSMGCQIALAFAGQFPERIKGFVLIDPSGGNAVGDILRPSFMKIYSYADEDYSDLTGAFVKRILKDIFYDDNLVTEELAEKYRERWRRAEYRKAIRRTVIEFSCSNPQTLYRLRYAGNRIRTGKDYPHQCLILWGREDPWFLVGGLRDYTNELTGSETQIIEQAGHLPHEEQPSIVNRAIIRTFRSNKGFIKHEKIEFDRLITNLKSDDINIAAYSALTLGDTKKDEAIEPLIDLLDHEKSYVRVCAQIALRKLGENMVELFIRKFSDKKEPVQSRVALITALGNIWNKRAVMPLINAINDSDQSVRSAAIYSLGNIKDKRAVEPLIVAINDSSQSVRERAIEALGKLGDKRAFEPIIAVIDDENEYVRDEAVMALGKFKDQRLIEALVSRLKDDGVIEDVGLHAAEALAAIGEPAVRPLMNALNDSAALARENACIGLGILKDPRAIDILIHALQDEDSGVRYEASRALAKIGEPAVEPLIAALKSENENARMGAAKALGAIKNPRAVNPLTDLLKDNKRRVKREAMRALGKLQSAEAVKPLAEIALRQEGRDAVRAVSALSKIGYPALPQLISIYKKFPRLREKTGDYLTEIIDLSIDSLVSALHDKD
ncbi:MAG TPA: alpha/beta fold hydrolase, partial [Caldithrix sp.]|nr:alpha/beta fold hydrolase [Caldithrix sp.]